MRKTYLLAMLMTTVLISCSKEPVSVEGNNHDGLAERVEIQLGTENNPFVRASKAPIEQWNNTHVGVFSMAKNEDVNWILKEGTEACLLSNLEGSVRLTKGGKAIIEWVDGKTYYYPVLSTTNYSFYGYYPYVKDVTLRSNVLSVSYTEETFNGTQDILSGCAVANDASSDYKGYNAVYLRKVTNDEPNLKFNHQLVRLDIYVKKGEDADNFKVTKIKFKNAPKKFEMVVASKKLSEIGNITYTEEESNMTTLSVKAVGKETEDATIDLATAIDKVLVGYIMLPINMLKGRNFESAISIARADGTPIYRDETELTRSFLVVPPDGKSFEKGMAYNINLIVNGPKEISVGAELGEWKTGGESDFDFN